MEKMHELSRPRSKKQIKNGFKTTKPEQKRQEFKIPLENNTIKTWPIDNINITEKNNTHTKDL